MTGYLKSQGIGISERKVAEHMRQLNPADYEKRKNRVRVSNPIPYRANYYGEKLHIDQNEKMFMFGVFHAACIDGHSGRIVRHIVIPEKNNILIYDQLYRHVVRTEGIWVNLRVDYGTEWNLALFVQNLLQQYRFSTDKPPFTQSFSKQNLRIERWWVEVNKRVNYPVKKLVCQMQEDDELPRDSDNDRRIVGEFLRKTVSVGVERLVAAWNSHRIDRKGIPNNCPRRLGVVPQHALPDIDQAVTSYETSGGSITRPSQQHAMSDAVLEHHRDQHFTQAVGNFESIFEHALAEDRQYFCHALQKYVAITKTYQPAA